MLLMTWGSMLRGNLRMLKSESDTKAFSASRTWVSSTYTYTANVVKATWKHSDKQAAQTSKSILLAKMRTHAMTPLATAADIHHITGVYIQWHSPDVCWQRVYLSGKWIKCCHVTYKPWHDCNRHLSKQKRSRAFLSCHAICTIKCFSLYTTNTPDSSHAFL